MNISATNLGYDPRPECKLFRGTPIPDMLSPLQWTERRAQIANQVWWNGPPWTILRNAHMYLYHALDYADEEDLFFVRQDVPRMIWCDAIKAARPGLLSAGAYTPGRTFVGSTSAWVSKWLAYYRSPQRLSPACQRIKRRSVQKTRKLGKMEGRAKAIKRLSIFRGQLKDRLIDNDCPFSNNQRIAWKCS